jgi:hypothetical protein
MLPTRQNLPSAEVDSYFKAYCPAVKHQGRIYTVALVLPDAGQLRLSSDDTKIHGELVEHHGPVIHVLTPRGMMAGEPFAIGFAACKMYLGNAGNPLIPLLSCTFEHKGNGHTLVFDMEEQPIVDLLEHAFATQSIAVVLTSNRQSEVIRIPVTMDTCDYLRSVIADLGRYAHRVSRAGSYIPQIMPIFEQRVTDTSVVHTVATQQTLIDALMCISDIPDDVERESVAEHSN